MLQKSRRYLLILLAVLVVSSLAYKFRNSIALEGFRWGALAHSLHHARLSLLLLGILLTYACFAVRAMRWVRLCRWLGSARFWAVYDATLVGFTCTFLLGRAGEPIRPVLIARKESLPMAGMFGVYILERILDIAATVVLAGSALLFFEHQGQTDPNSPLIKIARSAGGILLTGLIVSVAFLVYFRYHGAHWLRRKLRENKWRHGWRGNIILLLEGFSEGLQAIRTWNDLAVLIAYTGFHWLLVALIYLSVAHAFPGQLAELSFRAAVLTLGFGMVGSAIQLPGVGGGAQVAMFLVFTLILGVEKEPAAAASIMIWVISFASCAIVGLPLLLRQGWSMGELRRMARADEQAGEAELLAEAEQGLDSSENLP